MDCTEARKHLLEHRRGTLPAALALEVSSHLSGCEACRHEDAADGELSAALEARLPKPRTPEALRRSIEDRIADAHRAPARRFRYWSTIASLGAAAAIAAAVLVLSKPRE